MAKNSNDNAEPMLTGEELAQIKQALEEASHKIVAVVNSRLVCCGGEMLASSFLINQAFDVAMRDQRADDEERQNILNESIETAWSVYFPDE